MKIKCMPISRAKRKAATRKAVRIKARKKAQRRAAAKKAARTRKRKRILAAKKSTIKRSPI